MIKDCFVSAFLATSVEDTVVTPALRKRFTAGQNMRLNLDGLHNFVKGLKAVKRFSRDASRKAH